MEYYKPYTKDTLNFKYGILTKNNDEYFVNNDKVLNNRCINGDIVYLNKDNEIVKLKKRFNGYISGILHLNSNKKFGFTKKNVPYYKFTSLSNKFPNFIVPSKCREKKQMYCVIKINKWETNNKHPIGQIEYFIGEIGNIKNEIDALLFKNNIYPKKNKISYKTIELENELVEYNTFSIDPEGCKDIDDAISFNKLENNTIEIGIHIANVARYIENYNCNFFSTIYLENDQINMLDSNYTYNICSLGCGDKKMALSLILNYKDNKIINYNFKESIVINKSFSYQEADTIVNKKIIDNPIYNLHKFTCELNNLDNIISTKLIEKYMLLYNKLLAETLYNYNKNTILRTHKVNEIDLSNSLLESNLELKSFLNRVSQNAANYKINPEETWHEDLNIQYYTHATSPIRRYIDILNQFNMINYINRNEIILENNLDAVNEFNKNLRRFYNNYKKLKLIFSNTNYTNITAFIIDINDTNISIYIPDLDIQHNFRIISPKLLESNNVSFEKNIISINQTLFKVYDKIYINLTYLPFEEKFNKKINIKIIDPIININ